MTKRRGGKGGDWGGREEKKRLKGKGKIQDEMRRKEVGREAMKRREKWKKHTRT